MILYILNSTPFIVMRTHVVFDVNFVWSVSLLFCIFGFKLLYFHLFLSKCVMIYIDLKIFFKAINFCQYGTCFKYTGRYRAFQTWCCFPVLECYLYMLFIFLQLVELTYIWIHMIGCLFGILCLIIPNLS